MRFICQLFCLLLLLCPALAAAKPLRLSSDNFVLEGNINAAKGQKLLTDLELYRESLFHFMGENPAGEPTPVKIYVARNDKELGEISGERGFGGLYTRTHNGPSLLINGKIGFGRKGQVRHIALHEYSHHLFNTYIPYSLPRWYNEGLADYFATFTYKDGVFYIGKPYAAAAAALGAGEWLPMETILGSVTDYPFKAQESALKQSLIAQKFYAQSWLIVHYIQRNKDYRARAGDYISRLNDTQDSLKAFEEAFEVSPQDFQDKLRAYHKKADYEPRIFSRPPQPLPLIETEKLTREELRLAKLSARRDFSLNGPRAAQTIEAIETYERKYKASPESLMLKADLAQISADAPEAFERAYEDIQSALEQAPDSHAAKLIAARLIILAELKSLEITPAQREQARQYISDVLTERPNHRLGLSLQKLISAQVP